MIASPPSSATLRSPLRRRPQRFRQLLCSTAARGGGRPASHVFGRHPRDGTQVGTLRPLPRQSAERRRRADARRHQNVETCGPAVDAGTGVEDPPHRESSKSCPRRRRRGRTRQAVRVAGEELGRLADTGRERGARLLGGDAHHRLIDAGHALLLALDARDAACAMRALDPEARPRCGRGGRGGRGAGPSLAVYPRAVVWVYLKVGCRRRGAGRSRRRRPARRSRPARAAARWSRGTPWRSRRRTSRETARSREAGSPGAAA